MFEKETNIKIETNIPTNDKLAEINKLQPGNKLSSIDKLSEIKVPIDEIVKSQPATLQLNYVQSSQITLYEIPKDTVLYHGSIKRETFNPFDIKLGDDTLVALFSPNKRLSADYIMGCALHPTKPGFIHKFRVKKTIPRILIISTFDKDKQWNNKYIDDNFCGEKSKLRLNGIGFFFPALDMQTNTDLDSEFAICNPNEFLEYVSTQRCVSMRKLSQDYKI